MDPMQSRRAFLSEGSALAVSTLLRALAPGVPFGSSRSTSRLHANVSFASALSVARAIRRREISSFELTQHMLQRIERYNRPINAIVTVAAEQALASARAADQALAHGGARSALHGVPCTIKDSFETAGIRTTWGTTALADYVPVKDAAAVARLKAAGLVILGKTNLPEQGLDTQTFNDVFGTTNNPWNLSLTPGGSTGGGAAALAAGLSYLELGADNAGSIRLPAHFCGVFGHRPSLGVVPTTGMVQLPGSEPTEPSQTKTVGPLARDAEDLKAALQVLGGPESDEAVAYRWSLPSPRCSRIADYRIGYVLDHSKCPLTSNVKAVLHDAVLALEKAGARLQAGWPENVDPVAQYETWASIGPDRSASRSEFQAANARRLVARAAWQAYFRQHDAFLLPSAFLAAFPHNHSKPLRQRMLVTPEGPRASFDLYFWSAFGSLTGLPATTAPVGLNSEGLPVGVQVIGPFLEDATAIDVAGRLAALVGGFRAPKGYD